MDRCGAPAPQHVPGWRHGDGRYHRAVLPGSRTGLRRFATRGANYVERRARTVQRRLSDGTLTGAIDAAAEQAEVLIYFPEGLQRLYQVTQWLPAMERVAATHRVACVLRSPAAYAGLAPTT